MTKWDYPILDTDRIIDRLKSDQMGKSHLLTDSKKRSIPKIPNSNIYLHMHKKHIIAHKGFDQTPWDQTHKFVY